MISKIIRAENVETPYNTRARATARISNITWPRKCTNLSLGENPPDPLTMPTTKRPNVGIMAIQIIALTVSTSPPLSSRIDIRDYAIIFPKS